MSTFEEVNENETENMNNENGNESNASEESDDISETHEAADEPTNICPLAIRQIIREEIEEMKISLLNDIELLVTKIFGK